VRTWTYFVAAAGPNENACGHEHPRFGDAIDCARAKGLPEVWSVHVEGPFRFASGKTKLRPRRRATRRTT
jgi:hypothetical protein